MRLFGLHLVAIVLGGKSNSGRVRTPAIRAARNQRFLSQWFENNCPPSDDGIRPMRCANWQRRFFTQWDRMNSAFERSCGYFNPGIPNGGPPPARRRKRQAEDEAEDDIEEEEIFESEIFDMAENGGLTETQQISTYDYSDYSYIRGFTFFKYFFFI